MLGSICANALNIYSGSMSFLTMGVKLKTNLLRALTAVAFGVPGFFLAHWAMTNPANNLENFLLVMSYWIGPWLGVFLADKLLRRGSSVQHYLFTSRENIAGPIAFVVGAFLSIWLFANQKYYTGVVPKHNGAWGDIAFPAPRFRRKPSRSSKYCISKRPGTSVPGRFAILGARSPRGNGIGKIGYNSVHDYFAYCRRSSATVQAC